MSQHSFCILSHRLKTDAVTKLVSVCVMSHWEIQRDAVNLNVWWTSLLAFRRVHAPCTWGRVALSQSIIVPLHSSVVTKSLVLAGFYLGLRRRFVTFSSFRKLRRPEISLTCWFTGKFRFIFLTWKKNTF